MNHEVQEIHTPVGQTIPHTFGSVWLQRARLQPQSKQLVFGYCFHTQKESLYYRNCIYSHYLLLFTPTISLTEQSFTLTII